MIRKYIKEALIQVLHSLIEVHHEGLIKKQEETLLQILQECQKAAIDIGEIIENNIEKPEKNILVLEEYCEKLYEFSLKPSLCEKSIVELDNYIKKVLQNIEKEQEKILVVFFPYKASMWDSMESIWAAVKNDKRCECKVIPIPYYKLEQVSKEAKIAYEGTAFPEYVPITDYNKFSLEKMKPDIAYIHNPYDQFNYVTRVYADYYSGAIKQHVNKLIYVPYYVTGGSVSEHHKYLPVYENMDYMIAQSERFKEGFRFTPYYDKILPLGSPKFDRMINMSKGKLEIPEEWKNIIDGKIVLMLNTSINCFLSEEAVFFKKLWCIFKLFEEEKDIVLIWRPHPLLEATIKSMRIGLLGAFQELKQYFLSHCIGIYDQTPDISKTVIISDGYIGESASSVVSLFDIAGKPIFILDNYIWDEMSIEERRVLRFNDALYDEGKWWVVSLDYNGLFCVEDNKWDKIRFIGRPNDSNKWTCGHSMLEKEGDDIFLCPYDAYRVEAYNKIKQNFIDLSNKVNKSICAKMMFRYKESMFYLLTYENLILEYNIKTGKWFNYEGVYSQLKEGVTNKYSAYIWDAVCNGKYIYIISADSNKLLRFSMVTKKAQAYRVGEMNESFSGITRDSEFIYLAESKTGNIKCYNEQMQFVSTYKMPDGFKVLHFGGKGAMSMAHTKILDMEEWLITLPFNGNSMVKINKKTKKSYMLIPEFWEKTMYVSNGYRPWKRGVAVFAKKLDKKRVLVQRFLDGALAEVDIENDFYLSYVAKMSEESFRQFMMREDGFEKTDENSNFVCKESALFSVKDFFAIMKSNTYSQIRNHQIESLKTMTANLDGTCGQKVHEFMMRELL